VSSFLRGIWRWIVCVCHWISSEYSSLKGYRTVTYFDITVTFGRIGLMLVSVWVCRLFLSVFCGWKKIILVTFLAICRKSFCSLRPTRIIATRKSTVWMPFRHSPKSTPNARVAFVGSLLQNVRWDIGGRFSTECKMRCRRSLCSLRPTNTVMLSLLFCFIIVVVL